MACCRIRTHPLCGLEQAVQDEGDRARLERQEQELALARSIGLSHSTFSVIAADGEQTASRLDTADRRMAVDLISIVAGRTTWEDLCHDGVGGWTHRQLQDLSAKFGLQLALPSHRDKQPKCHVLKAELLQARRLIALWHERQRIYDQLLSECTYVSVQCLLEHWSAIQSRSLEQLFSACCAARSEVVV
jgi:hypothetical protein